MRKARTQGRHFRSGAGCVLGSVLTASFLCVPKGKSNAWAVPAEQTSPRCSWDESVKDELRVPLILDHVFGEILLCIEVNGKAAQVILDTGSNITILSPEIAHPDYANHGTPAAPLPGSGYVSTGQWGEANLHLGDRYWINRRVLVDEMRSISQAHRQRIDGILGRDILQQFRFVTIDFEKRLLRFGTR